MLYAIFKKVIILFFLLSFLCDIGLSQDRFYKIFSLPNSTFQSISGVQIVNSDIYVMIQDDCGGTNDYCTHILLFDSKGNYQNIYSKFGLGQYTSHQGFIRVDSLLIFSGNEIIGNPVERPSIINGINLESRKEVYSERFIGNRNSGVTYLNGALYLYGHNIERNRLRGDSYIKKLKVNTLEEIGNWNYRFDSLDNFCSSLEPDIDGNLVFYNVLLSERPQGIDTSHLVKIDINGQILGEFKFPEIKSLLHDRYLASISTGYLVSSNYDPDQPDIFTYGSINKLNRNFNKIEWSVNLAGSGYPGSNYGVYDIQETSDGSFLICGRMWDYGEELLTGYPFHGFMMKISPYGEVIWERVFKLENEFYPETLGIFKRSHLRRIREKPDGGIIAFGDLEYQIHPDSILRFDVWMISVDQDGCLEQPRFCDESNILTNITSLDGQNLNKWNLFPNPTSDEIRVEGILADEFILYNSSGKVVKTGFMQSAINISDLSDGVYYIVFLKNNKSIINSIISIQ